MPAAWPADFEERLVAHEPGEPEQAPPRRAAVAVVLRPGEIGHELLLMTRVEHERDPWSGQVSLPGGTQEQDDDDLLATALRETQEELGVDLAEAGRLLTRLQPVPAIARRRILPLDITPFVFRLEREVDLAIGREASEAFWLPLPRVLSGELDGEYPYRDGGIVRRLPCWHWEGRVIWGLTHRMVRGLLVAEGTGDW